EAKLAAESPINNSPARRLPLFLRKGMLPRSASALKQAQKDKSKVRWAHAWKLSLRHQFAAQYQAHEPSPRF
ncbi:hypothetical protein PAXINDRAFT_52830, partial [Paxillus involutus ATCC 200175]